MFKKLLKFMLGIVVLLALVVGGFAMSLRANPPEAVAELQLSATGQPEAPPVLIFGATRGTGLEVAKLLRARGDRVVAFVRPASDRGALEALGVEFVEGDANDKASVKAGFASGQYRAVVSTIGCLSCDPPPDFIGNRNITDAAVATGVKRFVLITSIGVGDSKDAAPWLSRRFLAPILPLKEQAETHLRASGLDYTIIRPGGLPPGDVATGRGVLSEEREAFGFIGRPDLARLIVTTLDDNRAVKKTYAAVDPARQFPWSSP